MVILCVGFRPTDLLKDKLETYKCAYKVIENKKQAKKMYMQ